MIKRIARDIPLFESLGLFTEAPKKKRKPRVISVRPIRKDYADLVDPEESFDIDDIDDTSDDLSDYDDLGMDDLDAFGDDISDDEFADDLPDDDLDDSDIDMDDPELSGDLGIDDIPLDDEQETPEDVPEEQPPVEGEATEPAPEPEEAPVDTGVEEPAPTPEEGTEPPVEGEVPVEGDAGGGEVIDATAGPEDPETSGDMGGGTDLDLVPDDGTDPNQMDTGDPNADQTAGEENITKDDVRKYELFKRFINLLKSIEYFIEKLENGVSDNENFEIAIKKAHKKFKSLEALLKDYMLLKFQTDSFLQNSFFYEKIKASTLLIFNLLELNKNKEDNK
mgnify:CR=1 FL=1